MDALSQPSSNPPQAFERLRLIVEKLRAPDGCPWDREQTHDSLRRHLIEEAYEVIEAIEDEDSDGLREELGDLMLQPMLHAQIASEEDRFDITGVLDGISDKLIRRHPHVFGEVVVSGTGEVLRNWDEIKKAEKAQAGKWTREASILDNVPRNLPALSAALEISKKAAKSGFEWPDAAGVFDKLREETAELEAALASGDKQHVSEELGDLLFTAVNIARWQKIDPELALRDMLKRFKARFMHMEELARERQQSLESLSPEEWEELWGRAKNAE